MVWPVDAHRQQLLILVLSSSCSCKIHNQHKQLGLFLLQTSDRGRDDNQLNCSYLLLGVLSEVLTKWFCRLPYRHLLEQRTNKKKYEIYIYRSRASNYITHGVLLYGNSAVGNNCGVFFSRKPRYGVGVLHLYIHSEGRCSHNKLCNVILSMSSIIPFARLFFSITTVSACIC